MRTSLTLTRLPGTFAIARAGADAPVPAGILDAPSFVTVSRTEDELSVVAHEALVGDLPRVDGGWACFKVHGPFEFSEVGIVARLSRALADAGVGIFVISTFDTDYILVKEAQSEAAADAWRAQGHNVS